MTPMMEQYLEIKEQRKDRVYGLYRSAMESLEKEIAKKIEEQEEASRQNADRISNLLLEGKRKQADCYTLRTDVADYKNRAVGKITEGVTSQLETMVRNVIKEAEAVSSDTEIQKLAEKEYHRAAKTAVRKLRDAYMSDLEKVRTEVGILGIPGWDGTVWEELRGYAPTYDSKKISQEEYLRNEAEKNSSMGIWEMVSDAHAESNKMLVGTGLIVGGFTLAPLPTGLSWAGGIAAVGIGSISYLKKRKEEKEAVLQQGLKETFKKGISGIHTLVRENADFCYGKIAEELRKAEEGLVTLKQEDAAEKEMIENLQDLQKRCHALIIEENKI